MWIRERTLRAGQLDSVLPSRPPAAPFGHPRPSEEDGRLLQPFVGPRSQVLGSLAALHLGGLMRKCALCVFCLRPKRRIPWAGGRVPSAGLSKPRAVERWEGLCQGSEFGPNEHVLGSYDVQELQTLH